MLNVFFGNTECQYWNGCKAAKNRRKTNKKSKLKCFFRNWHCFLYKNGRKSKLLTITNENKNSAKAENKTVQRHKKFKPILLVFFT